MIYNDNDKVHDNVKLIDCEQDKQDSSRQILKSNIDQNCINNENQEYQSINSENLRTNSLTEIDENDVVQVSVGDTADIEVDAFPDQKLNEMSLCPDEQLAT